MSTEPHSGKLAERLRALRNNPWFPIVGKGVALTSVMLGFSALGAVSMATTEPGVHVASQAALFSPLEWLAPTPPPDIGAAAAINRERRSSTSMAVRRAVTALACASGVAAP